MRKPFLTAFAVAFACDLAAHAQDAEPAVVLKGHRTPITLVMVTSDGTTAFALDRSYDLHWWKIASGEKHTLQLFGPQWLALTRDGKYVISPGQLMATNFYWATDERHLLPSTVSFLRGHDEPVTSAAFSADGKMLVTATGKGERPGEIRLWEVPALKERLPRVEYNVTTFFPKGEKGDLLGLPASLRKTPGVERLALSADGTILATAYASTDVSELCCGTAKIWETKAGKAIGHVVVPGWSIHFLFFAPDGKTLGLALAKENQGEVWVWDLASAKPAKILGRPSGAEALAFSPDGRRLAVGYADGFVNVWDIAKKEELRSKQILPKAEAVRDLTFAPDGETLVVGGGHDRGWIGVWRLRLRR